MGLRCSSRELRDTTHYSELADFFYAWQRLYPRGFLDDTLTTRHPREVQDTNPDKFAVKLRTVFTECRRILKEEGLLVFTYHHSRAEGWQALVEAVYDAGFSIVNAHPVKAEMSVAAPKSQAKEPIQLDILLVCKKKEQDRRLPLDSSTALNDATKRAYQKLSRLAEIGLKLSLNDRRITVISQFISALGPVASAGVVTEALQEMQAKLEEIAEAFPGMNDTKSTAKTVEEKPQLKQGVLF